MSRFSPEAKAFFGANAKRPESESQPPEENVEGHDTAPEISPETFQDTRDQLLASVRAELAETTGDDPVELAASQDQGKLERNSAPFLDAVGKFVKRHPKLRGLATGLLLSGLVAGNAAPAEAGLFKDLAAAHERHENKELFKKQQWEWVFNEVQRAFPGGHWIASNYADSGQSWYFEFPDNAKPYAHWQTPQMSAGEFLVGASGHLDYVQEHPSQHTPPDRKLVFSPGRFLEPFEIKYQQEHLRPTAGRLAPHPSHADINRPETDWPVLGPKAKAHQQIWKKSHPDQPLNMIEAAAQYFPKK